MFKVFFLNPIRPKYQKKRVTTFQLVLMSIDGLVHIFKETFAQYSRNIIPGFSVIFFGQSLFYSSFKCSFEFIEDFKIKDFE
jgi:hypothetical protein